MGLVLKFTPKKLITSLFQNDHPDIFSNMNRGRKLYNYAASKEEARGCFVVKLGERTGYGGFAEDVLKERRQEKKANQILYT